MSHPDTMEIIEQQEQHRRATHFSDEEEAEDIATESDDEVLVLDHFTCVNQRLGAILAIYSNKYDR